MVITFFYKRHHFKSDSKRKQCIQIDIAKCDLIISRIKSIYWLIIGHSTTTYANYQLIHMYLHQLHNTKLALYVYIIPAHKLIKSLWFPLIRELIVSSLWVGDACGKQGSKFTVALSTYTAPKRHELVLGQQVIWWNGAVNPCNLQSGNNSLTSPHSSCSTCTRAVSSIFLFQR